MAQDDAAAAQARTWTQWIIPLQAFADQGINLADVDKIAIGVGSKAGMAVVGGTGTIFVDDIALYRSAPAWLPQNRSRSSLRLVNSTMGVWAAAASFLSRRQSW